MSLVLEIPLTFHIVEEEEIRKHACPIDLLENDVVRSNPNLEFVFHKNSAKFELDVKALDVHFNLTSTSTQLMNEKVSWRGVRQKDFESLQNLMEALTTLLYVVLGAYTSTCCFMKYFQIVH